MWPRAPGPVMFTAQMEAWRDYGPSCSSAGSCEDLLILRKAALTGELRARGPLMTAARAGKPETRGGAFSKHQLSSVLSKGRNIYLNV
ncbi:hypothetical protein NDU88_008036 [Pleurodeles waltl]|uniref:Uncharacterized protein n=1 Tax=Pleurodeles waltl TaxID=8319 RepID=A0AAV7NVB7_PLEWA|nr:hypothetical protein NDU88_008036 [Pleurodeles waltl]